MRLAEAENQRGVAVAHVPGGALGDICRRRLAQRVAGGERPVLCGAPGWAPALAPDAELEEAVDELNAFSVPEAGLKLKQVYRETVYINSAIDLVRQNIWIGGSLAALILLIFLMIFRTLSTSVS